ncbi:MAG: beta-ketoacyl-[acyl-carrier-protein] synthase family protein, partial [Betaproteobacteria bacterium]|nr:beta-ketoacyl-[acyl-carrier-protein] synthase family protein [Betaproteobacteria bacterium]
SPANIAHPDARAIADCMRRALHDASLSPQDVGYVNAHATATEYGDIAEGQAIEEVFGSSVPVSSMKGHMGHTMAACGALESIICVEMLRESAYIPTLNLTKPDERCGDITHLTSRTTLGKKPVLKNSFALGGCNCTMILDAFHEDDPYEQ